jgi:hypothetical protein
MFCPKCATSNPDQAKFCRTCGLNLETLAVALVGQMPSPTEFGAKKEWIDKRSKGVRETVAGSVLLGVSILAFLVVLAIAAATGEAEIMATWFGVGLPWFIWGIIRLVKGIPDLVESKVMLRELRGMASGQATSSASALPPSPELRIAPSPAVVPDPVSPPSVTEHTTHTLGEHHRAAPRREKQ